MSARRVPFTLSAALALCLVAGVAPGLAQTGDACEEDACAGQTTRPAEVTNDLHLAPPFVDVLRRGYPIPCGNPADPARGVPDVECRVDVKMSIPAKAAKYLGLPSRTLAAGVVSERVEKYRLEDEEDSGRTYMVKLPAAVRARMSAKKVRALGVTITGAITVPGAEFVTCDSDRGSGPTKLPLRKSCPVDTGRKAMILPAPDGEIVCWTVMPWWTAVKSPGWGKLCPKPIRA